MRCLYCHNRDTWDLKGGKEITADDLLPEIRSYKPFFNASGGGVTVSGGEPLLQAKFVADLFEKLKAEGIHCVLDTNGFARELNDDIKRVVELADLVLLDIKHTDDAKHHELTHQHVDNTLRFANYLAEVKKPTWIRRVVVPGYSDDPQEIEALAKQCQTWGNVEKMELLPLHHLGDYKWEELDNVYPLKDVPVPTKEQMKSLADLVAPYVPEVSWT